MNATTVAQENFQHQPGPGLAAHLPAQDVVALRLAVAWALGVLQVHAENGSAVAGEAAVGLMMATAVLRATGDSRVDAVRGHRHRSSSDRCGRHEHVRTTS